LFQSEVKTISGLPAAILEFGCAAVELADCENVGDDTKITFSSRFYTKLEDRMYWREPCLPSWTLVT
jgi:hypothetical protein